MEINNHNSKVVPINLICPPAARSESTIALLWDKPQDATEIIAYRIYMNGSLHGRSQSTDYTAGELLPAQEYEVYVCSELKSGEISLRSNVIKVSTKAVSEIFDITDFGAIGDGKAINTGAIQNAINACTFGGMVYIPRGIFLTGAIFLKSNMTLYIEEGGVLLGSELPSDYPLMEYRFEGLETTCYASLINTEDAHGCRLENITIAGTGKIDANGSSLKKNELEQNRGKRGRALCLRNVDNVYLHGITVMQAPSWCVHLIYCNHISVNNIRIFTKFDEDGRRYQDIINGDGIDPDSSSDIYIFNSMIASQDDCIAIKSGRDEEGRKVGISSENIKITNCLFKSGFGVAVGSEMAGGVRNVLVQDCVFEDAYSIGSVKAPRGRGNVLENITYKDITFRNHSLEHHDCKWFRGAIYIDQYYSHDDCDLDRMEEVNDGTPVIKDVTFENIKLYTLAGNAIYMSGLPESHLQHISLINVQATGKYGLKAYNIDGLELNNVTVNALEDSKLEFHNISSLNIRGSL